MATGQQLQHAYELIKGGHKEHAASLLSVWLASDPCNADAWWLMALAAPSRDLMRAALVRLLELRPDDVRARQLLDSLSVRQLMADAHRAAADIQQTRKPAYPPAGMEPRLPRLKSRTARKPQSPRRAKWYLAALVTTSLIGVIGCGLVALAVLSGLEWVGRAFDGLQPALPIVQAAPLTGETFSLGDINALGNLGFIQYRQGVLAASSDRHLYTFTGARGDQIVIEVTTPDSALDPALALYAEGGQFVGGNADRAPGDPDAAIALTLPVSGAYTAVISAQGGTGAYRLELRR